MENMGTKIKNLRLEKGWTLEEVGNKVGVGKSTVRKWENGMIENMRRDKVTKLSEIFGVSVNYLLDIPEQPINPSAKEDAELIKKYHSLSDSQKQVVMDMIDMLLEKQ